MISFSMLSAVESSLGAGVAVSIPFVCKVVVEFSPTSDALIGAIHHLRPGLVVRHSVVAWPVDAIPLLRALRECLPFFVMWRDGRRRFWPDRFCGRRQLWSFRQIPWGCDFADGIRENVEHLPGNEQLGNPEKRQSKGNRKRDLQYVLHGDGGKAAGRIALLQ